MKKKNNTKLFVCRSPVSPMFWARILLSKLWVNSAKTEFVHKFRDNAVTGDIPLISLVLTSMVSPYYFLSRCPGFLGYTSSGCPTVCVLAHLCWASNGTSGGKTTLPHASMRTIYKQYLYNMTPYTLKIWARSWKKPCSPSPVITEHCACASRITRPVSPMRHIDTDRFLHDMTYHIKMIQHDF